jgi:hypothetical protein
VGWTIKKKNIVMIFALLLLTIAFTGCLGDDFEDEVYYYELTDAYCDPYGNFTFTLENFDNEPIEIGYEWSLKDPDSRSQVFSDEGKIILEADEIRILTFKINNGTYDARYYIIRIYIDPERGDSEPYEVQKSPDEWNYSTLPPNKKLYI